MTEATAPPPPRVIRRTKAVMVLRAQEVPVRVDDRAVEIELDRGHGPIDRGQRACIDHGAGGG